MPRLERIRVGLPSSVRERTQQQLFRGWERASGIRGRVMSLVGFSARNHPQQESIDTVDDRGTLPEFFGPLHEKHRFTIDAAASEANAVLPRFWTRETDALVQSWAGERVWCNPPYSSIPAWLEKAWGEMRRGCDLVVMLLPANRCEQSWWQIWVEPFRDHGIPSCGVLLTTRFVAGRTRFKMPADFVWGTSRKKGDRPPFGCVVLTWSSEKAPALSPAQSPTAKPSAVPSSSPPSVSPK